MLHLLYAPSLSILLLVGLYLFLRNFPSVSENPAGSDGNWGGLNFVMFCFLLLAAGLLVQAVLIGGVAPFFTLAALVIAPFAFRRKVPTWVFGCGLLLLMGGCYGWPVWRTVSPKPGPVILDTHRSHQKSIAYRLRYEENPERVARYSPHVSQNSTQSDDSQLPVLADIEFPLAAPPYQADYILLKIDYDAAYFGEEYVTRKDPPAKPRNVFSVVHQLRTKQFSQAMGFGVGRMPPLEDEDLRFRYPNRTGPLPDEYTPVDQFDLAVRDANSLHIDWSAAYAPRRNDADAHLRSQLDFLNPEIWNSIGSRETSSTMRSHAFDQLPVTIDRETQKLDEWRITHLELVSLLKHDTPRVYVDRMLPNMDTLKSDNTPTRDLDRFEHKSLRFLQEEYDVVIDEQDDRIRMFGSLRASQQCLQCHSVPQNTLLGAFTYELRKPSTSLSQN